MVKSAQAFRTISEDADEVGVAQHVLRFWETKFSFIHPMKRAGGRRFYRPSDVAVLATVRRLLHQEGYSIKMLQQFHRDHGLRGLESPPRAPQAPPANDDRRIAPEQQARGRKRANAGLGQALAAVESAKARLDALLDAAKAPDGARI